MLTEAACGVYVIAVTPFDESGRVDDGSTDRMVEFYRDCGVTGMTILGTMGEAPSSTRRRRSPSPSGGEASRQSASYRRSFGTRLRLHAHLVEGRHECGCGGGDDRAAGNVRTDDQIAGYYDQCVAAIGTDVPFVIQDYPLASGVQTAPNVIRRIVMAHPSCKMLKHEDWPGLDKINAVRGFEKDGSMRPI